jgi:diguanylate cyclase (GGDEF)-like protein
MIERDIVELIQNTALLCCIIFVASLIVYSEVIQLKFNHLKIKLFLGMIGSFMALITYIFNFTSQEYIVFFSHLFIIMVCAYLFQNLISLLMVYLTMILIRFNVIELILPFLILYFVLIILFLIVINYSKNYRNHYFTNLFLMWFTYGTVLFIYHESWIRILFTLNTIAALGGIVYFVLKNVNHNKQIYNNYLKYSSKDYLTKLYNRRKLDLDSLLTEDDWFKNVSIAFLDIDDFKRINDTYGHLAGDLVLKQLSEIILSNRIPGLSAYRLSGEEFCLMIKYNFPESCYATVQSIQEKFKEHRFQFQGEEVQVTISIGLVHQSSNKYSIREMITIADELMYEAKKSGKNCLIEKTLEG